MRLINLGCGTNRLDGWENYDSEIDIAKRLPWDDDSVHVVFAEHVVEHVTYNDALRFFMECHRVLIPGGVVRIAVPSIEQVCYRATLEYAKFVEKWVPDDGTDYRRRSMTNILFRHGHRAPWTEGLLLASLFYAGFNDPQPMEPGYSRNARLRGIEGHGQVIGEEFNAIETVVAEAIK